MITTIDECDTELARIDSEFKRLQLERDHVLNVRKFLEKPRIVTPPKTLTQRILEILTANPGISGVTVYQALTDGVLTQRQVSFTLANMRKAGRVENRGGRSQNALWYIHNS